MIQVAVHELSCMSRDGKTQNHIDHKLIVGEGHSSVPATDQEMEVAKVRDRLRISKQAIQKSSYGESISRNETR
jgi:hypothetical protein